MNHCNQNSDEMASNQAREAGRQNPLGGKDINPFARRDSIPRSPPRGRSFSVSEVDLTCPPWSEGNPAKRKRAEVTAGKVGEKHSPLIRKLIEKIEGLKAEIRINVNTKSSIKRGIEEVGRLVDKLTEIDPTAELAITPPEKAHQAAQTTEETTRVTLTSTSTQTVGVWYRSKKSSEQEAEEIKEAIQSSSDCDFESFRRIAEKPWPEITYAKVQEVEGNPVWDATKERDLLLCTDAKQTYDFI